MKKELTYTFLLLLFLTIITTVVYNLPINQLAKTSIILGLFAIKFIIVAFQFMDLKKANIFWKASVIGILIIINLIIIAS